MNCSEVPEYIKKNFFFFLTLCLFLPSGLYAQCTGADFEEQNGIVVIQMESGTLPTGWNEETGSAGFTGDSFIAWRGSDFFNTPGNGVITYTVRINTPGEYRFQWRSRVGIGTNSTEHNDSWLRIDDADSFFGRRASDGGLVFPRDRPGNPKPEGASSDGWLKAYLNGTINWTWSTLTSDNDGHEIFATFNNAGVYTIEVSGRSNGHFIDRMVLYRESQFSESQATDLSREETVCTNTMPDCSNLMLSLDPTPATTCNGTDGSVVSNVSGAQGAVTYSWSNGETTPNIFGLAPGTYTLDIMDAAGCPASASIVVGEPALPNVSLTAFANVSETDPVFALSGGSPVGGNYSGTGVNNNMFDPSIGPGTYTITYTYTDGTTQCTNTATQNITVDPAGTDCSNLMLSLDPTPTTTCNGTDGSIVSNVSGAQGAVTYSWSNGETTPNISGLAPGTYTLDIMDAAGCPASASIIVGEPALPNVSLSAFANVSETDPVFVLSGGSPAGGNYSGTGVNNNMFDPSIGPGTYTITYTYTDGTTQCTNTATQNITVDPAGTDCSNLMLSLDPTPTTTCNGTDGSIVSNVSGAQGAVTYSWSNGETTPNIFGLAPGTYTLDIMDAAGCPASASIVVGEPALPNVSLTAFANVSETDPVFALSGGSPVGGNYSGTGVNNNMFDPSIGPGTYTITYTYTDGTTQCTNTATQNIVVIADSCTTLPEVSFAAFDREISEIETPLVLDKGFPEGGVYSGPGVVDNRFDPSVTGPGTFTLTYEFTDSTTNCSNTATQLITVIENTNEGVFIFPNPIQDGRYRVKIPENVTGPLEYGIYDATGKALRTGTIDSQGNFLDFNVSNLVLQQGIYRLVIEGNSLEKPITISFLNN
ncbi:hypothetical protein [Spongiimicrobium salis]|uniref:hypothetical protein n=1 Tax=Spongiimicrobium salis TaxID=1667022 RepID=UPI00374DA801